MIHSQKNRGINLHTICERCRNVGRPIVVYTWLAGVNTVY